MTLHAYLYCINDPINKNDPTGEMAYWGAIERARGLVGGINTYYFILNMAIYGGPDQMLGNVIVANAFRESVFTDFWKSGNYQIMANAGYFGDRKSFLWNLVQPDDAVDQPEIECQAVLGFYKHCVVACRVHRYFLGAIPTYLLALYSGRDTFFPSEGEPPDSASDRRADVQGIINAWKFWSSCQNSCKKSQQQTIEKYCQ